MSRSIADHLADFVAAGTPAGLVTLVAVKGSTPREAGAAMLVSANRVFETIGGGRFEWDAIAAARDLLAAGETRRQYAVPLGPSIGQCCGGHATVRIERADARILARLRDEEAAAVAARPAVLIFGAGHVGRALAKALAPLPFRVRLIDGRAEEFAGFDAEGVACVVAGRATPEVDAAPTGAAYFVMTHSHSLDALIASAVLERGDFRYLGIIGSRSKKTRFLNAFREQGFAARDIARITCPIGGATVRDKRPAVIAALAAAELLTVFATDTASAAAPANRKVA